MKRIVVALSCVASLVALAAAQTSSSCVDLSTSLSRGMENEKVLALQNFLYAQGYMKVTPNGYFGPSTYAAVKALQKYAGFSQVGIAGPATRAYIKSISCQTGGGAQTAVSSNVVTTVSSQQSIQTGSSSLVFPRPQLDYIDLVTIFSGGQTDWGFDIHGTNFSSTTNTVYYKNLGNGMVYTIGTFGSADGATVTLPPSLGNTKFSCGVGCFQILPSGYYEVSVLTPGGQTSGKYMEIKPFTIKTTTATDVAALPATADSVKIGTLNFSTSIPVIVKSVSFNVSTSTISSDGLGGSSYLDVVRGSALAADVELAAFQTMIVDADVSTSNTIPGTVTGYFTVTVEDYIGKKSTTFTSPEFLATVQGSL